MLYWQRAFRTGSVASTLIRRRASAPEIPPPDVVVEGLGKSQQPVTTLAERGADWLITAPRAQLVSPGRFEDPIQRPPPPAGENEKCPNCESCFATKLQLQTHRQRAHGYRPAMAVITTTDRCPACNRKFATRYGAYAHLKKQVCAESKSPAFLARLEAVENESATPAPPVSGRANQLAAGSGAAAPLTLLTLFGLTPG